jgi:hypothetical protein
MCAVAGVYCESIEMQAALLSALSNERCQLFFLPADAPQVRRDFTQFESIRVYPMIKKLTALHFIQPAMSAPDRPAQLLSCLSYLACQLNHKTCRTK